MNIKKNLKAYMQISEIFALIMLTGMMTSASFDLMIAGADQIDDIQCYYLNCEGPDFNDYFRTVSDLFAILFIWASLIRIMKKSKSFGALKIEDEKQ